MEQESPVGAVLERSVTVAQKEYARLVALEEDFRRLLVFALKKCNDGGRGVFLREAEAKRLGWSRYVWPEARQLEEMGEQILNLRSRLGETEGEALYSTYLRYCGILGPNAPGAAKLARKFLIELGEETQASS